MKTKTFKQISKWELKKYDGYKCDFITDNWDEIEDGEN